MARFVTIPLDKGRKVRYSINAIREIEHHFNKPFMTIFSAESFGLDATIQLLTVGLKHGGDEKRPLTADKVGDLVQECWIENGKDLGGLMEVILDGLRAGGILPKENETVEEGTPGPSLEAPV